MANDLGAFPDGTGSRPTDRASDAVSPVPASIPNAARFPLLVRLVIRVGLLIFWFFAIGFVSAVVKHFLVLDCQVISEETLLLYRGGINMLLVLWFMGAAAACVSDRSRNGGDRGTGLRSRERGGEARRPHPR